MRQLLPHERAMVRVLVLVVLVGLEILDAGFDGSEVVVQADVAVQG